MFTLNKDIKVNLVLLFPDRELTAQNKVQERKELSNIKMCLFSLTFLKASCTFQQTWAAYFLPR